MADRVQLNLRLDGRRDLLETIKEVAAAEGLSVNAWVVKTLKQAAANPTPKNESAHQTPTVADIEPILDSKLDIALDTKLDTMLDSKLAVKFAAIDERLGKLRA